jgi:3-hydroxyacyl-CoA dehydrogenase
MTSPISTRRHDDVLIVTSNNPPVNALGHAVREGLVAAIEEADADPAVKAVVIIGEGQTFFAGADISEFGTPKAFAQPMLPQVVDIIEGCTKPVVAAIHGTAFGGGLEVALASHYRVAVPTAKLGVPEVKLGLLPGAGGTQRLPRVAGVGKALEMAAGGNPIGAKEAYECGLLDKLIEGDLLQHAVAYAHEVKDTRPIQKSSERDDKLEEARANPGLFDAFRQANAKKFRGFDAPEYNVRAIEAAVAKPYAEGVLTERQLFMELMSGTQAKAQQYFFFAERKAAKIEGLPGDDRRDAAGGARPRHRRDAQELPGNRRQGEDERRAGRQGDGPADADAGSAGAGGLRPHHRGRVREYGREEGDFRQARQDRQARRDPCLQHLVS